MKKTILILFFLFLFFGLLFVFGCKKAEKEVTGETINASSEEITSLINSIDELDLQIDLGNESMSEEEGIL
ncbi:MAG: hypothetical protein QW622_00785 [Candidatus Pacearchaeota archaeon]